MKKTNYEELTSMSVDDLAFFLWTKTSHCGQCVCNDKNYRNCYKEDVECEQIIKKWLLSKSDS